MQAKEREYWDLDLKNAGKRLAANTLQGLIAFDGQLHDSCTTGPGGRRELWTMPHCFSAFLRISLPKGKRTEFEDTTGLKLREPPVPDIPAFYTEPTE